MGRSGVRAEAGRTLSRLGDGRSGVGVDPQTGLPDIAWSAQIPAGHYTIGFDEGDAGKKIRSVQIGQPYRLARYPVTYAQFQCFVEAEDVHDSHWWEGIPEKEQQWGEQAFVYDNHPRERVSWYQAVAFCRWLTAKLHRGELPPGPLVGDVRQYKITLPHEYEWEVAARWPNETMRERAYPWGNEFDAHKANTDEGKVGQTTAVGLYPSGRNEALDIYDLSGNVWEWCRNKYRTPTDDQFDDSGDVRVVRGGSWLNDQNYARAGFRFNFVPGFRSNYRGFRVVVVVCPPSQNDR